MKPCLTILLAFCSFCTFGAPKKFYISNSGNDGNTGLSQAAAWKTIGRVNAAMTSIAAGDSILFEAGGTFYGTLIMNASGTATLPIAIGSYGTGAKPILSGLFTLGTWTNVSGNIWQNQPDSMPKANVNIFTIAGIPYDLGRTPNFPNYYVYQSASTSQLTSSSITGTHIGEEIVIKKKAYDAEKMRITGQSGTTVTYTPLNPIDNNQIYSPVNGDAGKGCFFQRNDAFLDVQGEWNYNSTTNRFRLYSTTNPNSLSIKASYRDTLVYIPQNKTNITIDGIAFEGAGMYAICSYIAKNITVRNCTFNNNTRGLYSWNTLNTIVDNNTFDNSLTNAIVCINRQDKQITITNNTIRNTGQLIGVGTYSSEYHLKAIYAAVSVDPVGNFLLISRNKVNNTGHAGIQWQGSNVTIEYNYVDTFCNVLDDNGAIYSFTNNSGVNTVNYVNRQVNYNFIHYSPGAPLGANNQVDVAGLYFDDQTGNVIATGNKMWAVKGPGIQLNNPDSIELRGNIVWDCSDMVNMNKKHFSEIVGVVIKGNHFYQRDTTQFGFWISDDALSSPTPHTMAQTLANMNMDSNHISNRKVGDYRYYWFDTYGGPAQGFVTSSGTLIKLTPTWQTTYGHDQHSILPPVTLTNSNVTFHFNPSDAATTVSFAGLSKIDPQGTVYNNSATLQRWDGLLLIDNGSAAASNIPPVANAGSNQAVPYPGTTTTLSGSSSTDADGTITAYAWRQVNGPSTAGIASPTSNLTAVNNLVPGVYQFELKVTDNGGASSKDSMLVTVNSQTNTPPTANAGADKNITLPTNSVSATGTATDAQGTPTVAWTQVSGPNTATITGATSLNVNFSGLIEGLYKFRLTATDAGFLTATDDMTVTVNAAIPPPNVAPTANADTNRVVTAPASTTTLNGSGFDVDGTISSYAWVKVSGPSGGAITSASSATTGITGLIPGTYKFELTVTDNGGATGKDTVQVLVNAAANIAPTDSVSANQIITLPLDSVTITAFGADTDGTITYNWTKQAGPATYTIVNPTSSTTVIRGLVAGFYTFRNTVTDNLGATAFDELNVTVNSSVIIPTAPTPNAGADRLVALPLNFITLAGSAVVTTTGATITNYAWSIVSGPGSATLGTPAAATTTLNNLVEGEYQVRLTVTDSNGLTAFDTVTIIVAPMQDPGQPHILLGWQVP